jgi:thioredoxin reductase (NADPH)
VKGLVKMNEWGYVETKEDMSTDVPGVYVAGDIRSKRFRQITTAVADGTIAALAVQKYVKDLASHKAAA